MLSSYNQKTRFSGLDCCWIFYVLPFSPFGGWGSLLPTGHSFTGGMAFRLNENVGKGNAVAAGMYFPDTWVVYTVFPVCRQGKPLCNSTVSTQSDSSCSISM